MPSASALRGPRSAPATPGPVEAPDIALEGRTVPGSGTVVHRCPMSTWQIYTALMSPPRPVKSVWISTRLIGSNDEEEFGGPAPSSKRVPHVVRRDGRCARRRPCRCSRAGAATPHLRNHVRQLATRVDREITIHAGPARRGPAGSLSPSVPEYGYAPWSMPAVPGADEAAPRIGGEVEPLKIVAVGAVPEEANDHVLLSDRRRPNWCAGRRRSAELGREGPVGRRPRVRHED